MSNAAQEGLERIAAILGTPNPKTGKPFSPESAVGEVMAMAAEAEELIHREMHNVPDSVRRALALMTMAVASLAVSVRQSQLTPEGK